MSEFTVTVLGSSGSYAAPGTACTGLLVQGGGANVLLDCGPGVLANLQRHLAVGELDAVVLTHCHPDHWVELPILRTVWTWFLCRTGLPVYGTAETREMNRVVCGGHEPDAFAWTVIDESSHIEIGAQRWSFSATDHPVETLAARVDVAEKSFAFSSDTGPAWSVGELGPGLDLALIEASYLKEREPEGIQHLSARQAGRQARSAAVKRLVLTHQLPGSDVVAHAAEAEAAFGGPVLVAAEHSVYEV